MPFVPNTKQNEKEMLKSLGMQSFEELLEEIPKSVRLQKDMDLPEPISELEASRLLREIAGKNKNVQDFSCFLGGGAYDHFIPAAIDHIISRSEFYTTYTPYQPEASQGTLQAAFEYQTMICELTGMDITNASLYDGGSALAEAVLLAHVQVKKSDQVIISEGVNPNYRNIIETYCHGQGIKLETIPLTDKGITDLDQLKASISPSTCGMVIQHPNFFGNLEDVFEIEKLVHQNKTLFIVSVDPISLGILTPPGQYNADIVTGEGHVLGNPLNYGGPYLGVFSVKRELVRRIPGRLIGETVDTTGQRGFVMTLQTREQHIRREKATSNICTNQALNALAATVYLCLLGKQGVQEVANHCLQNSHYLAEQISKIPNFKLQYDQPFFKEFVVSCPVPAYEITAKLKESNILAGIDLGKFDSNRKHQLLVAVTEKRSKAEMDRYVDVVKKHFA